MTHQSTYLYWMIVGCEAAFWLLLGLALTVRYLLKRDQVSRVLLLALPVVDILLLIFTALDLRADTPATFAHGLATAYVGFTITFGTVVVEWADQRFAHWFAGGPPPVSSPARGWPAIKYELALWLRCIIAWVITIALLIALIAYVDSEAVMQELSAWFRIAFGSIVFWFVLSPVWTLLSLVARRWSDARIPPSFASCAQPSGHGLRLETQNSRRPLLVMRVPLRFAGAVCCRYHFPLTRPN